MMHPLSAIVRVLVITLKIAGSINAVPVTLIGLVLFLYCDPQRKWWDGDGWTIVCKRLLPSWILGQNWGSVTLLLAPDDIESMTLDQLKAHYSPRLIAHEHVHRVQVWVWGIFAIPLYGAGALSSKILGMGWYRGNFQELQARAATKDVPR